jgi:hypothetical protein
LEGVSVKKLKPLSSDSGSQKSPKKLSKLPPVAPGVPISMEPLEPLEPDDLEPDEKVEEIPALTEAQEGVETAELVNPKAAFQPKTSLKPQAIPETSGLKPIALKPIKPQAKTTQESSKLPALKPPAASGKPQGLKVLSFETLSDEAEESPQQGEMTVLAGTAKLPSQKVRGAPRIKIPKMIPSPAQPISPAKSKISGVALLKQTTVVKPIPVISPKPIKARVVSANIPEENLLENIKKIDTTKLKPDRKGKNSYSVVELKAIAGSLNLAKSGSKKDLVERIKAAILRVNPSAEFE